MSEDNALGQEELKKDIQEFGDLKKEIQKAKKILSELEDFSKKFLLARDLLDSQDDGMEVNLEWAKKSAKESEDFKKSAEASYNDILEKINSIKEKIDIVDKAHGEFLVIQGKIGERTQTIEVLSSTSESFKNDIEKIKQDSQIKLSEIVTLFDSAKGKIDDMDGAYQDFLRIKGKIEDENDGLNAMLNFVAEIRQNSKKLRDEITTFYDQSKDCLKSIRSNQVTSDELKSLIQKNLDDSNAIKGQVQEVAALVTDTGFANAFQKRAEALLKNYQLWRITLVISVILLAIFLVIFFKDVVGAPDLNYLIFRITLTSPLLFLIWFSAAQYGKERDLNEKYEFKAVAAAVVRNHIKFLVEELENNPDEDDGSGAAKKFAIDVFKMIYKEPYRKNDFRGRLQKLENKIGVMERGDKSQNKFGIKDAFDSIQHLKSLIPDEDFKKIVDLLPKK